MTLKTYLSHHFPLCFQEHSGRVFRLQFDEFQIVSSSHDDTILIWDFLNYSNLDSPAGGLRSPSRTYTYVSKWFHIKSYFIFTTISRWTVWRYLKLSVLFLTAVFTNIPSYKYFTLYIVFRVHNHVQRIHFIHHQLWLHHSCDNVQCHILKL